MKRQNPCGAHWGKLVHQLLEVVTFAYDLRFRCTIAHWKGLSEEYTFVISLYLDKHVNVVSPQICLDITQEYTTNNSNSNWTNLSWYYTRRHN
jgi:hypothetical protein